MLNDVLRQESDFGISARSLVQRSGSTRTSGGSLTISAKEMLKSVSDLLNSNSWEGLSKQEVRRLCGIIQQVRSFETERSGKILSRDLYDLAMGLVHHPRFGVVGQEILTVLKNSDLPHAEQAAYQLDVLSGHGGSASEYLQHTIQKLAQPGQYGPLAFAVGSASLLGKGVRVLSQAWLNGGRLAAWGGQLAVHGTSGVLVLGAEAFYFPAGNNLGLGLLGGQMNWQHYGGEVLHGFRLMGGLNIAGLVSRNLGRAIHGVNEFGIATRARALAPIIQPALSLGAELGVVSGFNYAENGGDGVFSLIEGGATLLNIRIARHSGEALVPALRAAHYSLDRALYRAGKEARSNVWRRLVNGWNGGRNLGGGNSELGFGMGQLALEGVGGAAGPLGKLRRLIKPPSIQRELLEARYQGVGSSIHVEEPNFEDITLSMARDYYHKGKDPFPNFERDLRDRFLEIALLLTNPIGQSGKDEISAARMDWVWVLKEKFPDRPNEELIKKVDMSDKLHEIEKMRERLEDFDPRLSLQQAKKLLLNRIREILDVRNEMNLYEFCEMAEDYLDIIASDNSHYIDKRGILNLQIKGFPKLVVTPTFDKIDYRNYASRMLDRWMLGEHIIYLNGRGEYYDTLWAHDEKEFAYHDVGHSGIWASGLNTFLVNRERQIDLLWTRFRVKQASHHKDELFQQLVNGFWIQMEHETADLFINPEEPIKDWKSCLNQLSTLGINWSVASNDWSLFFHLHTTFSREAIRRIRSNLIDWKRFLNSTDMRGLFPPSTEVGQITNQQMIAALDILDQAIKRPPFGTTVSFYQ